MNFFKLPRTLKLLLGLILLAVMLLSWVMMSLHHHDKKATHQPLHYLHDNASADTKVEALKTVTANLLAIEQKNQQLSKKLQQLQQQHQTAFSKLQQSMRQQVNQLQKKMAHLKTQQSRMLTNPISNDHHDDNTLASNTANQHDLWVWVNDLAKTPVDKKSENQSKASPLSSASDSTLPAWLASHPGSHSFNKNAKQSMIKPMYTIPINATLTGATLMTPLVGRIPIDGKLVQPYAFKLVLSANNLTTNGYPMPGIHGAVMSGVASGDLLGHCVRGDIKSITFIFNDGTISTTQAKSQASLGYLSSETGNPCIAGTLHTNAALFLGSQMLLAGAEGYANAVSRSQYLTSVTDEGATLTSLVGSANKAAIAQGGSAASQAAQRWWNQRVQNSFDYVYVANQASKSDKIRHVVVNITQQIPINYNPQGRKVDYETVTTTQPHDLD